MKTILLVDDSSTLRMSMTSILSKAGYQAEEAPSAEHALDKLKSGLKPNLIITDLNMPGMDGIGLIREARKLPGLRFTPILMLTTESQQAKRQEARAAGATGWLVKPVAAEDLLKVIKQVVPGA
ncbi:response regulator [Deferrisoma camini]|uniref:response regulator n=1 Tax=Deferrisoma camini TaxID=1035120 RepID=UPI00046C9713|nr:response regulator [Deferrisoma camini]